MDCDLLILISTSENAFVLSISYSLCKDSVTMPVNRKLGRVNTGLESRKRVGAVGAPFRARALGKLVRSLCRARAARAESFLHPPTPIVCSRVVDANEFSVRGACPPDVIGVGPGFWVSPSSVIPSSFTSCKGAEFQPTPLPNHTARCCGPQSDQEQRRGRARRTASGRLD